MVIKSIKIKNFKNIIDMVLVPEQSTNVICGLNAQGKTNIIEAIWMFTGMRSFRATKDANFINYDRDRAEIRMTFDDGEREQRSEIYFKKTDKGIDKEAILNRVTQKNISALVGSFRCCVFSPTHLAVVYGGPALRRRFLDVAISQIRTDYARMIASYERILSQRNALLKTDNADKNAFDVWDTQLAKLGTLIYLLRKDFTARLFGYAKEFYEGISGGNEKIELEYVSTIFEHDVEKKYSEESINIYYKKLRDNFSRDKYDGHTRVGIHRDELNINTDGRAVKVFGSQGQQRSAVLSLKLAESRLIGEITGNPPVILLDDVLSELDKNRQEYILNNIYNSQLFLTCCDTKDVLNLNKQEVFEISKGRTIQLTVDN